MALIIRIDVDRPYGRAPLLRHVASRVSSDYWLPRMPAFGYLEELKVMLRWLNEHGARAYMFFRQCTLPCKSVMKLAERHVMGLHLENSRSLETFLEEKESLETYLGQPVTTFSKHGSGGRRYGRRHFAPYEPEKYVDWGRQASMRLFLGNLEDPTLAPEQMDGVRVYPSAFWLEPAWRDTNRFPLAWLKKAAAEQDVVLLVHPENVMASAELTEQFKDVIATVPSRVVEA